MKDSSDELISEHNYANIKTILNLHCFLIKFVIKDNPAINCLHNGDDII